jgi:hypothetical protein
VAVPPVGIPPEAVVATSLPFHAASAASAASTIGSGSKGLPVSGLDDKAKPFFFT